MTTSACPSLQATSSGEFMSQGRKLGLAPARRRSSTASASPSQQAMRRGRGMSLGAMSGLAPTDSRPRMRLLSRVAEAAMSAV